MLYSHDIENLALIPIIGKTSFAKKKIKKKKNPVQTGATP